MEEQTSPERIFDQVVCGVDGTPASAEAARQAHLLMPTNRTLQLVTVVSEAELHGGWGESYVLSSGDWERPLQPALHALPADREVEAAPLLYAGPPGDALVEELARRQATLVALGSHDHRRLPGILLGSVAVTVLHDAPCSVLVARFDQGRPRRFRSIAAGFDGSSAATAALGAAEAIAAQLAAELTVVVADGAEPPAPTAAVVVEDRRSPVQALRDARCDLLVLGSRGLHGIRALGSVSERVTQATAASVLVVRHD